MASSEDTSKLVTRDNLLRSLRKATGRTDVQIYGEPQVKRATGCIEGFTSTVLRVKVDYRFVGEDPAERSMVLFVKCMPQAEAQLKLVNQSKVFVREGVYFDQVLPIVQKVSRGKVEVPLPECYSAIYGGENDSLYLEDLTIKGFRTPGSLDLAHFIVAMKSLGRLHGLLVAAERAIPSGKGGWLELAPALSKEILYYDGEPPSMLKGMFKSGVENLLLFSKQLDGLPKEAEASGMLEKVARGIWGTMCRLTKPDSKGRNVLIHGDCWMNNMMFRYEKDQSGVEKPVDSKFIDLQVTRYCHPSLDILYFLYLCATKPFRDEHMNRLISDYYNSMLDTLKTIEAGPPPLTLDELCDDLYGKYKPFGVIIGMVFTTVQIGDVSFPPKNMTAENYKDLFETGNAQIARLRFDNDPFFRENISNNIREFVDMAFPEGIKSVDKSPLLICETDPLVNKSSKTVS